jgi:hypothetical protein
LRHYFKKKNFLETIKSPTLTILESLHRARESNRTNKKRADVLHAAKLMKEIQVKQPEMPTLKQRADLECSN